MARLPTNLDLIRCALEAHLPCGQHIMTQGSSNDGAAGHQITSTRTFGKTEKVPAELLLLWPRLTLYHQKLWRAASACELGARKHGLYTRSALCVVNILKVGS